MSTTKRLLALLLCLIMAFSVISCANDNSGSSDSGSSDGSSNITLPSEVPAGYVSLAEHEKANYRIVYEDGLASTVTGKINKHLEDLKSKIGVVMESVSDKTLPTSLDGMPEILVGQTNRAESAETGAALRSGEYLIKFNKSTKNVVITGGNISALGSAVDAFFKDALDTSKRYLSIAETYKKEKILDFPIQSVLIDGVPIQKYTVIYPKDADSVTKYAAQNLVDYLELNAGIKLNMSADTKAESQYEILVGKTKRAASNISTTLSDGQYVLMQKDGKIVMQGNGIYVGAAVGAFVSENMPANGSKKEVTISLPSSPSAKTYKFPTTFKNAIIMIGDGMGFNHIEMAKNGGMKTFYAEQFPNKGQAITKSLTVIENKGDKWTDSAAAATALATGYKTYNGRVGMNGGGKSVKNIRELADEKGAKTAVVTTDVINGATPGGFLAHNLQRKVDGKNNTQILADINALIKDKKIEYTMGRAADDVNSPNPDILKGAREALEIISKGDSQFFMMIEGAYIDKDSHNNRYQNCVDSVKQYNDVIAYMSTFVFCHPDTALIVTADHETGNLVKDASKEFGFRYSNNSSGNSSTSETAYRQHTSKNVPVFALGPKTEYFNGVAVQNVCIPHFAAQAFGDNNFGDAKYTSVKKPL